MSAPATRPAFRLSALFDGHIPPLRSSAWWLGMALVGAITLAALRLADFGWAQRQGLSALTLAIVLGMVVGNTFFGKIAPRTAAGVDYAKHSLLRAAIVLYGFRVLLSDIAQVGMAGVLIDMCVLSLTFTLALLLGTRVLGIDRHTAMLIGAGSSICGAAAVLATQPVLKAHAHKVSVAVATVVVFGTLSMVLYPLMYPYLGMSAHTYGLYTGVTVHEVAQVVVAGKGVSDAAAATAVIEKMLRVMMLAPFLMWLSWSEAKHEAKTAQVHATHATHAGSSASSTTQPTDTSSADAASAQPSKAGGWRGITVPWFAMGFIAMSALYSTGIVPAALVRQLVALDTALLTMAMAALGLRTHLGAVRQAGVKPIVLALVLFAFLLAGGYCITTGITSGLGMGAAALLH